MIDNLPDGQWLSAGEAAKQFAVSKAHWYVLASRKQFRTQVFNDGTKRYFVPNTYERAPNIQLVETNNKDDKQDYVEENLINQLAEAREQLRQVEIQRLEEQVAILKEDKAYLRDKLDDLHTQLPLVLEKIGRLQADNINYKQQIDIINNEKNKYKDWFEAQNEMATTLRKERDKYQNVILSIYKRFIDKNTKSVLSKYIYL
jgi:chromosome segregation ATPase